MLSKNKKEISTKQRNSFCGLSLQMDFSTLLFVYRSDFHTLHHLKQLFCCLTRVVLKKQGLKVMNSFLWDACGHSTLPFSIRIIAHVIQSICLSHTICTHTSTSTRRQQVGKTETCSNPKVSRFFYLSKTVTIKQLQEFLMDSKTYRHQGTKWCFWPGGPEGGVSGQHPVSSWPEHPNTMAPFPVRTDLLGGSTHKDGRW